MKALSIRQPWAGLIIAGIKTIENGPWRTNFRGPLLIQASVARSGRSLSEIGRTYDVALLRNWSGSAIFVETLLGQLRSLIARLRAIARGSTGKTD